MIKKITMKKLIIILGLLLFTSSFVYAERVELRWDARPDSENVNSYSVYVSQDPNEFTGGPIATVTNSLAAVFDLSPGTWYVIVIANNSAGSAEPSDKIERVVSESTDTVPGKTTGLRWVNITITIPITIDDSGSATVTGNHNPVGH